MILYHGTNTDIESIDLSEDTGCGIEQAMEKVYNSPLMPALQDEENELYIQSPAYLYEMMNLQQ